MRAALVSMRAGGQPPARQEATTWSLTSARTGTGSTVSASEMYGTCSEQNVDVLKCVGDSTMVLSYEEDRVFAALSLDRFGTIGSSRLDWDGAEVLGRCEGFDGGHLRSMVRLYAHVGELAILFWDNLAVPSVALEAALVANHAEAVVDASRACWIYLTDSGVLIEFQEGEGLTAGRVPS